MAEPTGGWWKLTFLRKNKSQPKVLYELPGESVGPGASTAADPHPEDPEHDSQLDARLERIVDKTTASRGRHIKVSHSGRYKEKKKVRPTLVDNPEMIPGSDPGRKEKKSVGK